jgi:hypothetical protein
MTLEIAILTALRNALAAAELAAHMAPTLEPTREMADELVNLAGRLACSARETQLRLMGVPEAKRGD